MLTRSPFRLILAIVATAILTLILLTPNPLALLGFTQPDSRDVVDSIISDKVQHALSYAFLTSILIGAFTGPRLRVTAWAASIAIAHGAATELLQRFVPERTCDWKDLVADASGVLVAAALYLMATSIAAARREPSLSPELPRP